MSTKAPSVKIPATGDHPLSLKDFNGKKVILYFYPKDNTPGCTTEAQDFKALMPKFKKLNAVVLGVSRDSLESHQKFRDKYELPFDLLSDEDEKLCQHYGVLGEKNNFGKKYIGLIRSTMLLDESGKLIREWRNVRVKGHAQEVLEAVQACS